MSRPVHSAEFRRAAVEKLLSRGSRPVASILEEIGVSSPTLYQWKNEIGNGLDMKKISSRPQDRSAEEKLKSVIEFENLPIEKRGEYLRRNGLSSENILSWRKQFLKAFDPVRKTSVERSEQALERKRIKELEKDLRRKEKALAETTALLVLKKKADLIWGNGEDE